MDGRTLGLLAVKSAAALSDTLRPPRRGVVVLIYHRVGARHRSEIDMPTDLFERQMAWLSETGRVISLDDAVDLLSAPEATEADDLSLMPTHNPVVITFDDGTSDLAEVALPILARHELPATVYLATRHVDEQIPWPGDAAPLSWAGSQEMLDSGLISFGSHTHSHALLDRMSPTDVDHELERSCQLIEDKLGVAPRHFAYPKAVAPSQDAVEELVRQRFRSAALSGNRPNAYGQCDLHQLQRTPIQVSDGMRFFRHKAAGGMVLEDRVRSWLNQRRYQDATS